MISPAGTRLNPSHTGAVLVAWALGWYAGPVATTAEDYQMQRFGLSAARGATRRLRATTFSALVQHPNYRLYWLGALTSNIGTWVQMVAQGWLVYELTGSAFYLGAVGFATAIPSLFLALVGGVLADRFERRRLMLVTQTGAMLLSFLLAILTLTGLVTVWHIMAIAFAAGVRNLG